MIRVRLCPFLVKVADSLRASRAGGGWVFVWVWECWEGGTTARWRGRRRVRKSALGMKRTLLLLQEKWFRLMVVGPGSTKLKNAAVLVAAAGNKSTLTLDIQLATVTCPSSSFSCCCDLVVYSEIPGEKNAIYVQIKVYARTLPPTSCGSVPGASQLAGHALFASLNKSV